MSRRVAVKYWPRAEFKLAHGELVSANAAPVLAPPFHFPPETDDLCLARAAVFGKVIIVRAPMSPPRHEDIDVPSDEFPGAVSKEPLDRRIHALHCPEHIDGHIPSTTLSTMERMRAVARRCSRRFSPVQIEYDTQERQPDHRRREQRHDRPPIATL